MGSKEEEPMTAFYFASLELTCDSRSESALDEFALRWTRAREAAWRRLIYSPDTSIEAALNAALLGECQADLLADLRVVATGVAALEPGRWVVDPAGGYVQSAPVQVRTALGDLRPWTFLDDDGYEVSISAFAHFDLIVL